MIREIEVISKVYPYPVYVPYLNYISNRLLEVSNIFRKKFQEIEKMAKGQKMWETDPYDMKIIGDEAVEIIKLHYDGGWKEILKELKENRTNLSHIKNTVYSFVKQFYEEINEERLLEEVREALNRMTLDNASSKTRDL